MIAAEVHRLQPWEEARGQLRELLDLEGCCLAARIGPVTVALPEELKGRLQGLIGQTICILRTDSEYRLRVVDGR